MPAKILLEYAPNGVATLTLNRPEARNALDWEAQALFSAMIGQLCQAYEVRALIITGAGEKAFCAGGDLVELADYPHAEDGARLSAGMTSALEQLENAPFPSVAALNGHAFGGGAEIALACDLRIMSHQAQMGLVQLSLGLTPGWGAGRRLLHLVGYSHAMHLLLMAQTLPSEEALRLGLVNRVVPQGQALLAAQAWATTVAGWDQGAVAAVKRVLRAGLTLPEAEAKAAEQAEFAPLWAGEAHLKAVDHFLGRKKG